MKTLTFKLLTLTLCIAAFAACKKNNPSPEVITKTDTITVLDTVHAGVITKTDTIKITKTDTIDCIPLSDIVEGTWYNYGYQRGEVVTLTTIYAVNFTDSTFNWEGVVTNEAITISPDYSTIYINQGNSKGSVIYNVISACSELSLIDPSNSTTTYLLRRNP